MPLFFSKTYKSIDTILYTRGSEVLFGKDCFSWTECLNILMVSFEIVQKLIRFFPYACLCGIKRHSQGKLKALGRLYYCQFSHSNSYIMEIGTFLNGANQYFTVSMKLKF